MYRIILVHTQYNIERIINFRETDGGGSGGGIKNEKEKSSNRLLYEIGRREGRKQRVKFKSMAKINMADKRNSFLG